MAASGRDVLDAGGAAAPAADAPLAQWLAWLEAGRGEHIDLGLDRCREVAARLGLERPAQTVVTVAGTNGKGSSVALLESIWRHAGYRVGTYTSPHLIHYSERMRIDGKPLDEGRICAAFAAVEHARGDVPLTYFEFGTLAALTIFAQSGLDIALLEVGLGGRLDAVNIVDADVAVIAAIGLDHEDWLGTTREEIGAEKAGIMRRGRPVVCSDEAVPDSILACAEREQAHLHLLGVDYAYERNGDGWNWWCGAHMLEDLPLPALGGNHQLRNASGVLTAVTLLRDRHPVSADGIRSGLERVALRGRFHRISGSCEHIMDVAHNPQAATTVAAMLAALPAAPVTHAVVGMLKTKNHREFLRPLAPHVDRWYFADLPGATGARATDLAEALDAVDRGAEVERFASVSQAHAAARARAQAQDRILVLGSFITVGAVLRMFDDADDGAAG